MIVNTCTYIYIPVLEWCLKLGSNISIKCIDFIIFRVDENAELF